MNSHSTATCRARGARRGACEGGGGVSPSPAPARLWFFLLHLQILRIAPPCDLTTIPPQPPFPHASSPLGFRQVDPPVQHGRLERRLRPKQPNKKKPQTTRRPPPPWSPRTHGARGATRAAGLSGRRSRLFTLRCVSRAGKTRRASPAGDCRGLAERRIKRGAPTQKNPPPPPLSESNRAALTEPPTRSIPDPVSHARRAPD